MSNKMKVSKKKYKKPFTKTIRSNKPMTTEEAFRAGWNECEKAIRTALPDYDELVTNRKIGRGQ